jgi:hypothetical protein
MKIKRKKSGNPTDSVPLNFYESSRVADPHHFNADPVPDPAFHFNADLDRAFNFNVDPASLQSDGNQRSLSYRPSRAPF